MQKRWKLVLWIAGSLIAAGFPPAAHAQDDTTWLLDQINALRASVGVPGYALNAQLTAAATQHSEYMASTCDVSHTEANGSTPASRAAANGYAGSRVSENIYGGGKAQASNAWNFWLNSGIHYAGMVSSQANEIGIGIAHGSCGHFFTLNFGYRPDVTATPAPVAQPPVENAAQAVPPTPVPYVPPPPTRTPTPTIPTLTPSATWTITPTYTPSPTGTAAPPTETPLVLPTVPALAQVAAVASSTPTQQDTAIPESATPVPPAPVAVALPPEHQGFQTRDLIPFALAGQIVLIGLAGLLYFRRSR
jgi:hypothetical protein